MPRAPFLFVLVAALALWALSRTRAGQDIAASLVGRVVDGARELVAELEGLRLDVYQDTGGAWTVGYGHLVQPGERFFPYGDVRAITLSEAEQLLEADMATARNAVAKYVTVPLTDGQRAALESFVFNVGVGAFAGSTLLRKLNQGDYVGAAGEFDRWVFDNGRRITGLERRRAREKEVFTA